MDKGRIFYNMDDNINVEMYNIINVFYYVFIFV